MSKLPKTAKVQKVKPTMENWRERIWVSLIVDNLAAGCSEEEILEAYPSLTREDIRAALAFAAEMARERYVPVPLSQD